MPMIDIEILSAPSGRSLIGSRKPEEMRAKIERLLPRAFCCELFAREAWPGHEVWGNQAQKFDSEQ